MTLTQQGYRETMLEAAKRVQRVTVHDSCRYCGQEWRGIEWAWYRVPRPDDHDPGMAGYRTTCCHAWIERKHRFIKPANRAEKFARLRVLESEKMEER